MELSLSTYVVEGHVVIEVGGELDAYTSPRLRERLVEIVDGGARRVVLDITGLEFLDSAGVGVMTGTLERLRAVGGRFAVVADQERLPKIFHTTGTDRVLPLFGSVHAAVGHQRPATKARATPTKAAKATPARKPRPPKRSGPDQPAPTRPAPVADDLTVPSWLDESRLDFFKAVCEAGTVSVADLADIFKIPEAEVRRILKTIN